MRYHYSHPLFPACFTALSLLPIFQCSHFPFPIRFSLLSPQFSLCLLPFSVSFFYLPPKNQFFFPFSMCYPSSYSPHSPSHSPVTISPCTTSTPSPTPLNGGVTLFTRILNEVVAELRGVVAGNTVSHGSHQGGVAGTQQGVAVVQCFARWPTHSPLPPLASVLWVFFFCQRVFSVLKLGIQTPLLIIFVVFFIFLVPFLFLFFLYIY